MSWELLTKVFKLDPSRLHVTCFEGDEKNGVPRDTESRQPLEGSRSACPDDHIHYFGKDNFWEMGDTGPCGPVHRDLRRPHAGQDRRQGRQRRRPARDGDLEQRLIQYNRNPIAR
jgi:alanyl-tRNA synthetase